MVNSDIVLLNIVKLGKFIEILFALVIISNVKIIIVVNSIKGANFTIRFKHGEYKLSSAQFSA